MAARGVFITFEGGDGSGKSTQIQSVREWFASRGREVIVTREPGGTELGTEIRRLVQNGPEDVDARTEALLYAADSSGAGAPAGASTASSMVATPPSKRSTRTPRISEKTSSIVPTASMTTMRSGSASASRRYWWRTRSWKSMDSRSMRSGASVRRRAPTSGGRSRRKVRDG